MQRTEIRDQEKGGERGRERRGPGSEASCGGATCQTPHRWCSQEWEPRDGCGILEPAASLPPGYTIGY